MTETPKPRLAASTYLNSAPLVWSFIQGSQRDRVDFTDAVPAKCADLLAAAAVDFALVPVIEYHRLNDVQLVPDVCVGSQQEVRSVVLVSPLDDLRKVRSVALDESSRTSANLVKIIFQEFLKLQPAWITSSPDLGSMLRENDAALIIGDPGMLFEREGLHVWDLAALWRENTALGFVFAMWMGRELAESVNFVNARSEGLDHIEQIVSDSASQTRMPSQEIRDYLRRNIVYQVNDELQRGMELYFELAFKHGLIPELKPIRFMGTESRASSIA